MLPIILFSIVFYYSYDIYQILTQVYYEIMTVGGGLLVTFLPNPKQIVISSKGTVELEHSLVALHNVVSFIPDEVIT